MGMFDMEDTGMSLTFNYPVEKLKAKLRENRQKYEEDYKTAVKGYKRDLEETFKKAADKITSNAEKLARRLENGEHLDIDLSSLISGVNMRLEKPKQYLKFYDEALAMLEMTADETIALPRIEFNQLVLDKWVGRKYLELQLK